LADVHSSAANGILSLSIDTDHNGITDVVIDLGGITAVIASDFIF
jgi:hypothetical protein